MPDLVTHTAAAYFLSRSRRFEQFRALFYLGAVLPDLLARPIYILFPKLFFFTVAIHTPVFMIIFTLLFSEFFSRKNRASAAAFLFAGITLHFFMDFFQRHLWTVYYLLFPFSWRSFELPLFWPETPVRFIPVWIVLVAGTELALFVRKKRTTRASVVE